MKNRFIVLSLLLLIAGGVLYKFRGAAMDVPGILSEQATAIERDFQQRTEEAARLFRQLPSEVLFNTLSKQNTSKPDFAFHRYDSTGLKAWTYEGFGFPFYQLYEEEELESGMGVVGLSQRMSPSVRSYIPVYIPQGGSFSKLRFDSRADTTFRIKTKKGLLVAYLKKGDTVKDYERSKSLLIALLLFFLIFSFWIVTGARWLRNAKGDRYGGLFQIGGLLAFAGFYYLLNLRQALIGVPIFAGSISVGSWLIWGGLALWGGVVFFRRFSQNENRQFASGIALTNYGLSLMAMLILAVVLMEPFTHWEEFGQTHVLGLNARGWGILIFACMLALTYFLFSHRLALNTHKLGLSKNKRLLLLVISVLLFGSVIGVLWGWEAGAKLALMGFIYLLLFDFYLDSDTSSLTWLISWIFVLSLLLSLIFVHFYPEMNGKKLMLFSLLFSINTMLVFILAIANMVIGAVSFSESFPMLWGASLRNKIQLYVILLTLGSFIAIGVVTVNSFNRYNHRQEAASHSKLVKTIVKMVETRLADSMDLQFAVRQVSRLLGEDVNLYYENGRISNQRGKFFTPLMQPLAYEQLRQSNVNSINTIVSYPGVQRKTTYVPIRKSDRTGLAYIGIPYRQKETATHLELLDFIGDLLIVYVFLLIIISSLSIVIANLITKPISKMGQKLKDVSLDGNERLEWEGKDEIGQLVQNYNAMIAKLEKSTALLRQSEREGAWREMAKQVAHEIKNPLTPMKLSIQHLMRVYNADPEQAAPLIKKMSQTLVEQIEGLATIADEFSNFAKMPKAQPEEVSLNKLIQSVVDLFVAQPENAALHLSAELPREEITIQADKNHLTRILNNLLKNAIQSIPEERAGMITVQLSKEGTTTTIQVKDNGSGIPEEVQPRVFQPNFTTKNSGTGIGLAMTKSMVENAGGTITFRTIIGEGTVFVITF